MYRFKPIGKPCGNLLCQTVCPYMLIGAFKRSLIYINSNCFRYYITLHQGNRHIAMVGSHITQRVAGRDH